MTTNAPADGRAVGWAAGALVFALLLAPAISFTWGIASVLAPAGFALALVALRRDRRRRDRARPGRREAAAAAIGAALVLAGVTTVFLIAIPIGLVLLFVALRSDESRRLVVWFAVGANALLFALFILFVPFFVFWLVDEVGRRV